MINSVHAYLTFVAIWLAPTLASSAELFERIGDVEDTYFRESPVTAEAVVAGLVRYSASVNTGPEATDVLAEIPAAWAGGEICVRVTTNDGLYSGRGRFASPDNWDGQAYAAFPYKTETSQIFGYEATDIAIVTKRGKCDGPLESISVASWGAAEDDLDALVYLLLNSFRADFVFLLVGDAEILCEKITNGTRASFDFRCPINTDLISGGANVEIFRLRGNSADPPLSIELSAY